MYSFYYKRTYIHTWRPSYKYLYTGWCGY